MNSKEESVIFIIQSVIGALNDIKYEMENYTPDRGFFVGCLEGYRSSIDQDLQELGKYFEKETNDV